MTPYEKFLDFYNYDQKEIKEILDECTHCYFDNEVFVCGYMTHSSYLKKTKINIDKPDTWYVVFAAGNITKLFSLFTKLKYLCYHRANKDNKIRLINYKRLRNLYGQKK
tara:strand:+ start:118 stop:444 length:327 start_codon:yes stop_codon:yes gene_type:complete